jgi:hypothetical protein
MTVVTSLVTIRVTAASAEQTFQNLITRKLNKLKSAMGTKMIKWIINNIHWNKNYNKY